MDNTIKENSEMSLEGSTSENIIKESIIQDSDDVNNDQTKGPQEQKFDSSTVNDNVDVNLVNEPEEGEDSLDISKIYSPVIEGINKVNFYVDEKKELLEIIVQYNELIDKIEVLDDKLEDIKNDELQANILYDDFKRTFTKTIDDCPWIEKLFYALPLFEDYEENDKWINQWCKTMELAIREENRCNLRNFINRNFYNAVFSLPKDVYCYKVTSKDLEGLSNEVLEYVCFLSSRIAIYIKYIKDFSEQLRNALQNTLTLAPIKATLNLNRINIIPQGEINSDLEFVESLINDKKEDDRVWEEIHSKYSRNAVVDVSDILSDSEKFVNSARTAYQEVLNFQNRLGSVNKQVYTSSLLYIYKLYDSVAKSLSDLDKLKKTLIDTDETSLLFIERLITIMVKLQFLIEKYLKESCNIRPLTSIQEGANFNDIDINWYEVLVATDAPSSELVECISSISDTGFAKFNVDGEVDFVVRPARISVYKKVVNATSIE